MPRELKITQEDKSAAIIEDRNT